MPSAISDSSTLIHLAKIGRLNLLKEFYEKIILAPAVWKEVVEEGHDWPGSLEVKEGKRLEWINVIAPSNTSLVHLLRDDLHQGEAETIALAVELNSEVVFLDESELEELQAFTT